MSWSVGSAIILAAGGGRRMGGAVKALLPWGRRTMLAQTVATAKAAGFDEVIVVAGHGAERVRPLPGVRRVVNPSYRRGLASSIRAGIRAVDRRSPRAALFHVDKPLVRAATVRRLLRARGEVVVPVYRGLHGHPVLFARSMLGALARLRGDVGARSLLRGATRVAVDDPGVVRDIDTWAAYRRLSR